jgi:hypothetical protein
MLIRLSSMILDPATAVVAQHGRPSRATSSKLRRANGNGFVAPRLSTPQGFPLWLNSMPARFW